MASEVSICNRSLQKLGAARITSLSEDIKNARACNANYFQLRDALLRRHAWGFSRARVQLAADTTGPVFGKTNFFTLPSDCLRPLPPNSPAVDWEIEGRKIATDWSAPLDLIYIKQITDPNEMDALFREALSSKIAEEICEEITQSNTKKADMVRDFEVAMSEAKKMNAFEQTSASPPEDEWVDARLSGFGNIFRADNKYA